jgi:hypothetical protein
LWIEEYLLGHSLLAGGCARLVGTNGLCVILQPPPGFDEAAAAGG